ncbi:MAG: hypothetical protein OIF56_14890 [Cohaesibacter sp.]|nr:hypothetical protein [Cohaesibacter sp.]
MDAQVLQNWLDHMGLKKGTDLSKALGWNRNRAQEIIKAMKAGEAVELKKVDELAMSALAQNLKPWSEYDR